MIPVSEVAENNEPYWTGSDIELEEGQLVRTQDRALIIAAMQERSREAAAWAGVQRIHNLALVKVTRRIFEILDDAQEKFPELPDATSYPGLPSKRPTKPWQPFRQQNKE